MSIELDHKPLLTHEIGSLDKPGWRVKAYAGQPLNDRDLEEARTWGERLQVPDYERLIELLGHAPSARIRRPISSAGPASTRSSSRRAPAWTWCTTASSSAPRCTIGPSATAAASSAVA